MLASLKNVVVVGGSYVGLATVKELASILPATHNILLIEPHSHFHHLFAFPRFAVLPSHEHKAFIPYTATFASAPPTAHHAIIKARVESLKPDRVVLDREWRGSKEIAFEYLIVATGTRLQAPGTMSDDDKPSSVKYFKAYQERIRHANSIAIIGGGAVGVQMATDLKELYPNKGVTLVHSREQLMPLYHPELDRIIKGRCGELGIRLVLGSRVIMSPGGLDPNATSVKLQNGSEVSADLIIPAIGQVPNIQFLSGLEPSPEDSLINPVNRFIRVKPTLQFADAKYPNLFAVGDVADSGAHKAARPGAGQAQVVARNIVSLIEGKGASEHITVGPPGIHLTLGLTKNLIFRNPDTRLGETEPTIKRRDDGQADMGIDGVWKRRGIQVNDVAEYHL